MKHLFFKHLPYLAVASFCIFLIAGCQKGNSNSGDNATPDYYISFKVNGIQKKYTNQAIASISFSSQSKLYDGVFAGYQINNVTTKSHIGLFIFDNNDISAKIYQDPQKATAADGSKMTSVLINYYNDDGKGYLSMGPMVDENGNSLPGLSNVLADAKVTITTLTSGYVEGSFSGTLMLSTDATFQTRVAITEGKFILKRIQ